METLRIALISPAQTLDLRQQVLWPHKPVSFVQLPEDDTGTHFGAFLSEELVSVMSVFLKGEEAQFRKFATAQAMQGRGIGSQLLQHLLTHASSLGLKRIWCHARQEKAGFYRKFGFKEKGTPFFKEGVPYVVMDLYLPGV
ncbi:GNAT family N-acetyltransferase [Nibribacter ruber]|uniref:GNAT family N-acetyltransferase n=1 Tax=Nibribacter ruber TaxID=2698458 RepID=A0A6P1NYT9_9BACT|nr:GNAT family N-acetyltransferase [Nibribacter ruber]QHL86981.1 GNAT family N-acetyltransferase [Nibribacter ruber]